MDEAIDALEAELAELDGIGFIEEIDGEDRMKTFTEFDTALLTVLRRLAAAARRGGAS